MEFYQSILYFYFFTLLLMFRYIGQLLKLSMKTIFSDAIINDPNTTLQPVSLRNMPILGDFPLRLSVSPQKRITSKKFFYPVRNKSFATQQMKPKQQLEALLKRQKVVLMTQRNHINDLLMPLKAVDCEKQLMAFPALQIKKAIELKPNIENSASKNDKSNKFQFKLNSIRKDYHSNILGSLLVQNSEYNQKNWESQKKNQESQQLRKSVIMPKISTKKAHPPMSPQKDSKVQQSNPEVSCPSPSVFNRNRSQFQIQPSMPAPQKKKYRKGYLSYEVGGIQFWKKLKNNIQNPPKISVDKKIITAKTFFGLDLTTFQPIIMENAEEDIQIASLSKIMTCYLTIMIGKKYEVDLKNCIYRVPDWITQTPGTSAQLEAGDVLSAYDLLYALMLPSGNDASICLAELMGKVIQRFRKSDQNKSYTQAFLAHMNFFSKQLELSQQWGNSSGLSNNPNFSTAKSIVALATLALRDETFRKVVSTQQYEINIKNDRYGLSRKKSWKNTNKLLQKGWDGVKTGTTESAGHCLMAKKESVLLGVFDCQTLSKRFSDAIKLNEFISGHCF